jgi:isopentenyl-diphosphate Delta-isomerase
MAAPSPTSLIDIVDDKNGSIGVLRRRDVFRMRANFRTVHVLVFNARDQLLLQHLAWSRERHPGQWGSSVAGYMHAGEKYEEAAQRRLFEELGLSTPLTEVGVTRMEDEGVAKFVGVFTTTADHPKNAAPDQIAEIKFCPLLAVEQDIAAQPSNYTDTFRHVLGFWREATDMRSTSMLS